MGDAKAVEEEAVAEDFGLGLGVGAFPVGEGIGDGSGVAPDFGPAFEARAASGPLLVFRLELLALRALAAVARSAEFLLTAEFLFAETFLLAVVGEILRLFALAFLFDSGGFKRGNSRPLLVAAEEFPPGTVNTTSIRFPKRDDGAVAAALGLYVGKTAPANHLGAWYVGGRNLDIETVAAPISLIITQRLIRT